MSMTILLPRKPFAFDAPVFGGLSFYEAVGMGLIEGASRLVMLGNNPDIDTSTDPEDAWPGGGLYPWKSAAGKLEVVSNSTGDASGGTGASRVLVRGLDASGAEIQEVVTLIGTVAVQTSLDYYRVNSSLLLGPTGSNGTNVGAITIRDVGGGTTRAVIPAGVGITRQAVYTVPMGKTAFITKMVFFVNSSGARTGAAGTANFSTFIQVGGVYRLPLILNISQGSPWEQSGDPAIPLLQGTDFTIRITDVSENNTNVTAAVLGVVIDNVYLP